MSVFQGIGILFTVVALCGFINFKWVKLPDTLGITAVGLALSAIVTAVGVKHPGMTEAAKAAIKQIDFTDVVFHGLLSLLLFAGSLHVDLTRLKQQKLSIFLLATVGVLISTAVVGGGLYFVLSALGTPVSLLICLMFGALISPTDPIAVLSVLKKAKVAPELEAKIAGEALFNDGTAVVAFMTLLGLATGTATLSAESIALSLAKEVIGAAVLGLIVGYGATLMLRQLDSYAVEILITLALATAGFSLAEQLHVSAPLAVVIMGLVIGNLGKQAMSESTREHLFSFWELLDELLNLLLFGLIGLEVIALTMDWGVIWLGLLAVPVVLVARAVSVGIPFLVLSNFRKRTSPNTVEIMTWGGLRGGISIALALSLPMSLDGRDTIVGITYVVVIFSLLVQATTLGKFMGWLKRKDAARYNPLLAGDPEEIAKRICDMVPGGQYSLEDPVEYRGSAVTQLPMGSSGPVNPMLHGEPDEIFQGIVRR
ncbi:Na(+)/H(+) antiporter NhaP [Achromobacter anxifer]|uniref:cation:proton antiporter n=1 Tax=Achromobacter anxifer TaxID=1287737 RepID=UPI00155C4E5E|nr:sodium:proton antiporter [Achromobacter anxifer]CAB5514511.1 Na(+)/H(+) antiporter NhaP [Achromobacter anxifer]